MKKIYQNGKAVSMAMGLLSIFLVFSSIVTIAVNISAEEPPIQQQELVLSVDLLTLLRAEMREISVGMQNTALALATADWKAIQATGDKIRQSYVMEKKLTPSQAKELAHALPEHFKQLDAEFHQRAVRLGTAASAHDAELVAFHYGRLIESCVLCHAAYARSRFPGFASSVQKDQHHH